MTVLDAIIFRISDAVLPYRFKDPYELDGGIWVWRNIDNRADRIELNLDKADIEISLSWFFTTTIDAGGSCRLGCCFSCLCWVLRLRACSRFL